MFNYIKKSLLCLLIFVIPYMNLALKAMDEEEKGEKNYILRKNTLYTVNDQFHTITEENKRELKHRESKIYYRNDSCCNFPSCCRICLLDPFEEAPKKGDTVKCLSIWMHATGQESYIRNRYINGEFERERVFTPTGPIYSCGYKAIYESDNSLRVITPHSKFCWEEESYLYSTFCCFGEWLTCGLYTASTYCCTYKSPMLNYDTTGSKEITDEDMISAGPCFYSCTWICGWI